MTIPVRKLMRYRGWKVWMSYDMHVSLLAIFYILIVDNLFRPFDSLILISSLGFYFMYGFLINDFYDMPYDIAAGKRRAVQELSRKEFISIILLVVFISALHLLYLKEPYYIATYVASYILATLYSAPPIRFKNRGVLGIIINGFIEKMLPVLAVFAFFTHFGIDTLIFLIASFFIGIVDILTHQIYDYDDDLRNRIRTFVVDIGIEKGLKVFKSFISPFSAVLMVIFSLLICIKVQYASFIASLVFITYAVAFLLISKGKLSREEEVFPLYMSCLFLLILNALPPFLAFILVLENPLNMMLLLVSFASQYYVVKYRFKAVREKVIPHIEIFVDTEQER